MSNTTRLLTPQDRDAVARLQLLARGVVEGITVGRHRSPHKGASVEFKEHRQYVKGDEIRSIDWKLFGKTDRLYIRQYEDETNLRAMILLDQSGSMGYCGARASGVSKQIFATRLAACLATLLISQQDSVGLCTFDTAIRELIPARGKVNHLLAISECLVRSRTGSETQLGAVLQQVAEKLKRRGMLILISDCFDDVDSLMKSLAYFRHSGSEVVLFQVWDRDELDFPFGQRTQFRSLEIASHQRLVDPSSIRNEYLKRVDEFRQTLTERTAKERIDLIQCTTDQSYSDLLSTYVARREGSRRGGSR
ncbi:MAG: DUF58 domain-containing protein [Pirellulaceae bacterium]|nr:DUF58 domain-containing protein [Pirellulaceae bacterium]